MSFKIAASLSFLFLLTACSAAVSPSHSTASSSATQSVVSETHPARASPAQSQVIVSEPTCLEGDSPYRLVLKESFRTNPNPRDGTHRYFFLEGCASSSQQINCTEDSLNCQSTAGHLSGTVRVGKESDADYSASTPKPLAGTETTLVFEGSYQAATAAAHGSTNAIQSGDGQIKVNGNFYSNRDISFQVGANTVPASEI